MKKVKNAELKESKSSHVRKNEGKIKKKKQKIKLHAAADEAESVNLPPKNGSPNIKIKNDHCLTENNNVSSEPEAHKYPKVANNKSKTDKQKEIKSKVIIKKKSDVETSSKELTEDDLNKIEKKKAKKLEKKLRKAQKNDEIKSTEAKTNIEATSNDVLTKKEKKAAKKKMIRDQKLVEKRTRDPSADASTVFVGNLPVNTKRVQIARLFKAFAPVHSIRLRTAGGNLLLKHKQRKKAGSLNAYIVLKNKETAENALSLNGVEFKDNHLRVTLVDKNPQNHEREEAKRTVFIGNLKYSATEESLRTIFSSCGEIDYVRCLRDGDKGCKGVAYVCFKTADAVGLALELNGTIVDERPINVERFSVKKLGAKEARDALAEKQQKSITGAKKRINNKKDNKNEKMGGKNNLTKMDDAKKPKKSEFRGVKVEGLKKKQKPKKKKSNDQMVQLAKKIAPKIKTE